MDYYLVDVASKFRSRLEIVFDPQPFHTDAQAAARTVLESRASASRPGVGLVKHRWEARNQDGELVLSMEGWGMFGRKPA